MRQQSQYSVERLTRPSESDCEAVNVLLPQLSSSARPLSYQQFSDLAASDANMAYVARNGDGTIVGIMLLVVVRQLVGTKCWIEDVVVDDSYRGKGIAHAMMEQAIAGAPDGIKHINLTSKLAREAAHGLYYGLGFKRRDETAVFRLTPQ